MRTMTVAVIEEKIIFIFFMNVATFISRVNHQSLNKFFKSIKCALAKWKKEVF